MACNYDAEATIEDGSCIDGTGITVTVGGGAWDSEIGWSLFSGDQEFASGGAGSITACVPEGCFTFAMTDSYGDGWNGAIYTLSDADGTVIATGDLDTAMQGTFHKVLMWSKSAWISRVGLQCHGVQPDAEATLDDGSCDLLHGLHGPRSLQLRRICDARRRFMHGE